VELTQACSNCKDQKLKNCKVGLWINIDQIWAVSKDNKVYRDGMYSVLAGSHDVYDLITVTSVIENALYYTNPQHATRVTWDHMMWLIIVIGC